jgi:hypothetical protein
LLGGLALRLAFEIRFSLLSLVSLLVAGGLYVYAGLLQLEVTPTPVVLAPGVVQTATVLVANLALLSTVGFFARHVYLDAKGRLKVHIDPAARSKSKRAKLKVVKSEKANDAGKAGQASSALKPAAKPAEPAKFGSATGADKPGASISKSSVNSQAEGYEDEDEDSYDSGLSKSERRRLKKLARREQRRAA